MSIKRRTQDLKKMFSAKGFDVTFGERNGKSHSTMVISSRKNGNSSKFSFSFSPSCPRSNLNFISAVRRKLEGPDCRA